MVALRSSLAALFLVFGACSVGEVPAGGGGGGPDAAVGAGGTQAVFDATIKPLLTSKGCIGCHSGGQAPNFSSYATLDAKYRTAPAANSKLITEAADGAPHNGATYFTAAEKTTISNWIEGK